MKVKVISRSRDSVQAERKGDLAPTFRNVDPALHPFEKAREYTRALNATKLERVFAKPFVGALSGHMDGIYSMCKHPRVLSCLVSGAGDGEIRVWDLSTQTCLWNIRQAHNGYVRGLCVSPSDDLLLSCGDDATIKLWNLNLSSHRGGPDADKPTAIFTSENPFMGIDHCFKGTTFATGGMDGVQVWDEVRAEPIQSYQWGADTVISVRYNPAETEVLACTATDRSITLFDTKSKTPIRKMIMEMRANTLRWNPMEPFHFTVASEDHNLYSYDMRNLSRATWMHVDHTSAVLDVDYSPTGTEFVSGSYDRSIRIWNSHEGRSREIYHTSRMQRVFTVAYSLDSKYVLSGSDDMNIRLWKSNASKRIQSLTPRERRSDRYTDKLKERYAHMPEIRRIARHRTLPKAVYRAKRIKEEIRQSERRKRQNMRRNSKRGAVPVTPEKRRHVIKTFDGKDEV